MPYYKRRQWPPKTTSWLAGRWRDEVQRRRLLRALVAPTLLRGMRTTVRRHGVSVEEAFADRNPKSKAMRWHGAIQLLTALGQADFAEVFIKDRSAVSQPLRLAFPLRVTHASRAHYIVVYCVIVPVAYFALLCD